MIDSDTLNKASAGDYDALAKVLRGWVQRVETFVGLPYWDADYEDLEDAAREMRVLACMLVGDHPGDPE